MGSDATGEYVEQVPRELQTRIAQALYTEGADPEGLPWDRISDHDRRFWRRLADAALGSLRHDVQVSWALYNPTEEAYRLSLNVNDGVFTMAAAVERMAPYHHDGDGYEVIEQRHQSWSTGVYRVPDSSGGQGADRG